MTSMFTSISFERKFGCLDSFSHSFFYASKDVLLIPKELVKISIGVGDTSSHKLQLAQIAQIAEDMDDRSDVEESSDEDFDSDYVVDDDSSDDGDDEDFDVAVDNYEADPDYHPVEFVWDCQRRFRLNAKVALMAWVDMSLKITVQNLNGVDTVVYFRLEKHGKGFRYVASEWVKKFTKPNRIYKAMKCKFAYCLDKAKLILKKVYK
ncbi:hypothetical protein HanPI659440_Chr15g0601441 [Helianthus annuus]|nr:hypothetical protein HanPI659440_Chr15g0601441 [Helianthus annuus]